MSLLAAVLYSHRRAVHQADPDWGGMAINGGRTAIALVVYRRLSAVTRHKPRFNRWIFLGACCVCATNVLFALANKITTAANAIVLEYTAPIFVILLSALAAPPPTGSAGPGRLRGGVPGRCCASFWTAWGAGHVRRPAGPAVRPVLRRGVHAQRHAGQRPHLLGVLGRVIEHGDRAALAGAGDRLSATALVSLVVLGVFQVAAGLYPADHGLKTTPPVTASLVSGIEPVLNPILVAVFYHEIYGRAVHRRGVHCDRRRGRSTMS